AYLKRTAPACPPNGQEESVNRRRFVLGAVLLAAPLIVGLWAVTGQASGPKPLWTGFANDRSVSAPIVSHDVRHDVSRPLRDIAPQLPKQGLQEAPENPMKQYAPDKEKTPDAARQGPQQLTPMPALQQNFDTQINTCSCYPPDTNGDVGTSQYVQTVNLTFAVYSKTGQTLYGPASTNTIWNGFGGACQTTNNGDPIAQWDPMANRWIITQFAFPNGTSQGPYEQ